MEIVTERIGDVVIVKPKGRFYSSAAVTAEESFVAALRSVEPRLVIDMSELEYISSAGLRVLLKVAKQIQKANGKVVLFGLNRNVREVFSITAFDRILSIHTDQATAVAALQ
jgi:stage II sporulation protein AA (anti-sigma F factor antagonist)